MIELKICELRCNILFWAGLVNAIACFALGYLFGIKA